MTLTPRQRKKVLTQAGRKGGKAKVPKGFAKIPKEQLKEISDRGRQNRWGKS
jgi:hypothetical protein